MNVNPPFVILALAAGFLFSWFFVVVKSVTREVPLSAADAELAPAPTPAAAGSGAAVTAAATTLRQRLERGAERLAGHGGRPGNEAPTDAAAPRPGAPPSPPGPATRRHSAPPAHPSAPPPPRSPPPPPPPARSVPAAAHVLPRDPSEVVFRAPGAPEPVADAPLADAPLADAPAVAEWAASEPGGGHAEGPDVSEDTTRIPVSAPPGLAPSLETGPDETPAGYAVKGDQRARLYLVPSDPDFDRAKPDIWFLDEHAAITAGYTHYLRRADAE